MKLKTFLLFLATIISNTQIFSAAVKATTKTEDNQEKKPKNEYIDTITKNNGEEIELNHLDQKFYYIDPITDSIILWHGIYNVFAKKREPTLSLFKTAIRTIMKTPKERIIEQFGLTLYQEDDDPTNLYYSYIENDFKCIGTFDKEDSFFLVSKIEKLSEKKPDKESPFAKFRKRASSMMSNGPQI